MDMGRLAPPSWLLSGSSQLLLLMLTLGTIARVANGCQISGEQVSTRSETTITVTWTEVGVDATSYVLQLYDQSTFTESPFTINGSASNFTFTGLVPGRYYSISVTVNCNGGSYISSTVDDSTLPPKAKVTITDKTMTSMSFSWEVYDSSLDYYARLEDDNNINQSSYVESPGSITFTKLIPDTNYYAYVESTFYWTQESDVVMDRTLPAKVNVNTIAKNATTITVSWNMSSVDLYYYTASLKEHQDGPNIQFQTRTTIPQNVTFTGLVPGRNYFVFVTIYISVTNTISVTFTERTLPPKVNVTISVSSPTAMTVSWVAPISDVDYYVVYLSETYNATAVKSAILSSFITTQAFTDLVPGRSYNASVTVYSGINSQLSDIVTNITYMSIRLAGSNTTCQGRVEVFHNGQWGTVCDDFWNSQDAKVVCRQLGCGLNGVAKSNAYFGQGSAPIFLDDVRCSGYETQLSDCSHLPWEDNNCDHYEDASVICSQGYISKSVCCSIGLCALLACYCMPNKLMFFASKNVFFIQLR